MKKDISWLLVDTETTGFKKPIHAVEIAAQLMIGWEPAGEPFRTLINVDAEIPSEVSRVHGYTKEILERDGIAPTKAYKSLAKYANGAPVCAYNLDYDYDNVLLPTWERLGFGSLLPRGFCLLRLTQRLIDPVPAGNHKLQTLRQFYRLPERGAHTALGDVQTVIDLLQSVLLPIARIKNLVDVSKFSDFTQELWFPAKIPFGKFRGRSFRDANNDEQIKDWLIWLSESDNENSRSMGQWYLDRLRESVPNMASSELLVNHIDSTRPTEYGNARMGIIVYVNAELNQIKALVTAARERLADLEMVLDRERLAVAKVQSELFRLLKADYKQRDLLKLIIDFRKRYLNSLLGRLDLTPEDVCESFNQEKEEIDEHFRSAEQAAEDITILSDEQSNQLKDLYRKLVKLYHPDLVRTNEAKARAYSSLMAIINDAKARMDIDLLREIAADPSAFMKKHALGELSREDFDEVDSMIDLYQSLQSRILETIAAIDELRESDGFLLYKATSRRPDHIQEVAEKYRKDLEAESVSLEAEANKLKAEIDALDDREAF